MAWWWAGIGVIIGIFLNVKGANFFRAVPWDVGVLAVVGVCAAGGQPAVAVGLVVGASLGALMGGLPVYLWRHPGPVAADRRVVLASVGGWLLAALFVSNQHLSSAESWVLLGVGVVIWLSGHPQWHFNGWSVLNLLLLGGGAGLLAVVSGPLAAWCQVSPAWWGWLFLAPVLIVPRVIKPSNYSQLLLTSALDLTLGLGLVGVLCPGLWLAPLFAHLGVPLVVGLGLVAVVPGLWHQKTTRVWGGVLFGLGLIGLSCLFW